MAKPSAYITFEFGEVSARCQKIFETQSYAQARRQKFAMGGCFRGLGAEPPAAGGQWGLGAKPLAARSTGVWGRSSQRSKILHFFAKIPVTLF